MPKTFSAKVLSRFLLLNPHFEFGGGEARGWGRGWTESFDRFSFWNLNFEFGSWGPEAGGGGLATFLRGGWGVVGCQ